MKDFETVFQKVQQQIEDKERITKILDKLNGPHDLIFLDMSTNDIDAKIVKARDERKDFLENIKKSKSLETNFKRLVIAMEDYLTYQQIYILENKIKPLTIKCDDLSVVSVTFSAIIKCIRKIREEMEIDEELLIIYAYLSAKSDFMKRVNIAVDKAFEDVNENSSKAYVVFKFIQWMEGNHYKIIKKAILKDKYIKEKHNEFKDSYKQELKLAKFTNP